MNSQLRQLLHAYTSRRSPWGPPWWIYGVAFGAVNLIRQAVIIVTTAEIPQSIRVASWVATGLVVVIVVNSIAVALQRRGAREDRGQEADPPLANPEQAHATDATRRDPTARGG